MVLRIALTIVAALLIAAHFLRTGSLVLSALCLASPLLLLVRRGWSLMLLQLLLYAAAIVWLATAWQVVGMRQAFGEPWLRAAVILVAVAAFTAIAGAVWHAPRFQQRYRVR